MTQQWSSEAPSEQPSDPPAKRRRARGLGLVAAAAATVVLLGALVVGRGEPSAALPAPVTDGSAGYAFLYVDPATGHPARFNPCEEVRYVVNPQGAPEGVIEDVHEAFRRAALATGITFTYEGTADEVPRGDRAAYQPDRYGQRWAPVLIGWTTIEPAAGSGKALGWASNVTITHPERQDVVVSGTIAMEHSGPAVSTGFGAGRRWGNVALHEIGHLLGLDHSAERGQVMTTHVGYGAGEWGAGDLAGLVYLGREAGCVKVPDPRPIDVGPPQVVPVRPVASRSSVGLYDGIPS